MNDPVLTLLGFSRKAGKLIAGTAKVQDSIKGGKAKLVLICSDISAKTEKELRFFSEKKNIPVIRMIFGSEEVSHAAAINAGVLSVIDEGFAAEIQKRCNAQQNP